jgi:calcium-binding protein CML
MGCRLGKPEEEVGKTTDKIDAALEKKLLESIMDTKRRKSYKAKKSSFNGLLLQLPRVRQGFKRTHEMFHTLLNGGQQDVVDVEHFARNCISVGIDPSATSVKEFFEMAQKENIMLLNRSEFSLAVTIIYLQDNSKKQALSHQEIKKVRVGGL